MLRTKINGSFKLLFTNIAAESISSIFKDQCEQNLGYGALIPLLSFQFAYGNNCSSVQMSAKSFSTLIKAQHRKLAVVSYIMLRARSDNKSVLL